MLELGGKNPTIVHASADLKAAARRIAYGRFSNSGHICTAPDHVLVWPEVKDAFVAHLKDAIREFYGDDPKKSPDYGRIINRRTFDRLAGMISNGTVAAGGESDAGELYIAPTVLVDVPLDSQIMKEEVFGPILPVLVIDSVEKVIEWVNERPDPLGLYVFSEDESVVNDILERTSSGDAVVNDCALHPLVQQLPFGGVGNSGHGQVSRPLGIRGFHQRTRGPVSQFTDRPRRQVPAIQRAQARARDHEQVRRDDPQRYGETRCRTRFLGLRDFDGALAGGVSIPIYEGGALRAKVEIATAQQAQAIASYGAVALAAFREVENSLANEAIVAATAARPEGAR